MINIEDALTYSDKVWCHRVAEREDGSWIVWVYINPPHAGLLPFQDKDKLEEWIACQQ